MRHHSILALAVAGIIAVAASDASAQEKPAQFVLGGGYTAPNSEVRDHLGDGYHFNIGAQFNISPIIGIEGLYSFNGLGDKRVSIPVAAIAADVYLLSSRLGSLAATANNASLRWNSVEMSSSPRPCSISRR